MSNRSTLPNTGLVRDSVSRLVGWPCGGCAEDPIPVSVAHLLAPVKLTCQYFVFRLGTYKIRDRRWLARLIRFALSKTNEMVVIICFTIMAYYFR
jgi:hypothetical protein